MRKKHYILFTVLALLSGFQTSYSSTVKLDAYEEDMMEAKVRSLVSGVPLEELHSTPAKAAITLGFTGIGKGRKHAYLVFEMPERNKGEQIISVRGIHLGRARGWYYNSISLSSAINESIYGGRKANILLDSDREVIMKFACAKKIESVRRQDESGVLVHEGEWMTTQDAIYEKYKTFIVSAKNAQNTLDFVRNIGNIYFSSAGWGLKKSTYNCVSLIAKILTEAGIGLRLKHQRWLVDHRFLEDRIREYEALPEYYRQGHRHGF